MTKETPKGISPKGSTAEELLNEFAKKLKWHDENLKEYKIKSWEDAKEIINGSEFGFSASEIEEVIDFCVKLAREEEREKAGNCTADFYEKTVLPENLKQARREGFIEGQRNLFKEIEKEFKNDNTSFSFILEGGDKVKPNKSWENFKNRFLGGE